MQLPGRSRQLVQGDGDGYGDGLLQAFHGRRARMHPPTPQHRRSPVRRASGLAISSEGTLDFRDTSPAFDHNLFVVAKQCLVDGWRRLRPLYLKSSPLAHLRCSSGLVFQRARFQSIATYITQLVDVISFNSLDIFNQLIVLFDQHVHQYRRKLHCRS